MKKFNILIISLVVGFFIWNYSSDELIKDRILIGQSAALTGSAQNLGIEFTKGANTYFKYINELGGIHGRNIELITLDDSYEPEYSKQNTIKLIKEKNVFAMFGQVGTPTSEAVLPIIEKEKIPFLTPLTGSELLRNNDLIINLRKSYKDETRALVKYLIDEYKIKKIAVFYQNDNYGKSGYEGVKDILKNYDLEIVQEGRYRRNTLSFQNDLIKIYNSNPEAVIIIGTYKTAAHFIKEAKKLGMTDTKFCNVSFVGSDSFIKELEGDTRNILISQVLPLPWDESNIGVKEYQEIYRKYNLKDNFSFISFEGFLSAKLVVKALEKSGKELNRKKFLDSFYSLDKNTLDGFEITLSKKNNEALNEVYIFDLDDSKYRILEKVRIDD